MKTHDPQSSSPLAYLVESEEIPERESYAPELADEGDIQEYSCD
jgi:hypothetical protein